MDTENDYCHGHAEALAAYATRLLRDPERARDVIQETALKWMDVSRPGGTPPDNPRAWLYRVTRNLCLDILRKDARLSFTGFSGEPGPTPHLPAPASADPARQAVIREEREAVLQKIEGLPPRQQEALRLKFQEGMSYAEIAEITGDSVDTVGWLLHTALKTLRGQLAAFAAGN